MNCTLPGSSVHGISQARILEWVAISYSKGSSQPRDRSCISCSGRGVLYPWTPRGAPTKSTQTCFHTVVSAGGHGNRMFMTHVQVQLASEHRGETNAFPPPADVHWGHGRLQAQCCRCNQNRHALCSHRALRGRGRCLSNEAIVAKLAKETDH